MLDFSLREGVISVDHTSDFHLELPEGGDFGSADLAKDESADIKRAEGLEF